MKEVDLGPIGSRNGETTAKALMEGEILPTEKVGPDMNARVYAREESPGVTHLFAMVDDSAVDAEVIAASEAPIATKPLKQVKSKEELILESLAEELSLDPYSLIEKYQDKVAVGQAVENHDSRPSNL